MRNIFYRIRNKKTNLFYFGFIDHLVEKVCPVQNIKYSIWEPKMPKWREDNFQSYCILDTALDRIKKILKYTTSIAPDDIVLEKCSIEKIEIVSWENLCK